MSKFNRGVLIGSLSGISWGMNTVIIGFILSYGVFLPYSNNLFISALVIAFLHDFFSSFWLLGNLMRNKKIKMLILPFKSKVGYILIISSILGGPIGMAGYLLGVKYIGPSYAASFSALYPALGTILAIIILKEKINNRIKFGVLISGIGILLLSYSPIDLSIYPNYLFGIFFSLFCVLGWAFECVIASYSMRYGEVDSSVAICIRQLTSSIFYALIIIPYIKGYPLIRDIFNSKIIYLVIFTALIGSLSYLFWYKSIDMIGAPRGMSLNITYIIWTIIFEKILFNAEISMKLIFSSIVILLGIILIAGNPKEMVFRKDKR